MNLKQNKLKTERHLFKHVGENIMIKNKFVTYRTPTVLTRKEINQCKAYIEYVINYYISAGNKSFCVKDLFGYETWNWSTDHPDIECIYDAWVRVYTKRYSKKPGYNKDIISEMAYKQAGISLGYLVKQTARDMKHVIFKIKSPSRWNIIYTVV